jgi:hypothetical protein
VQKNALRRLLQKMKENDMIEFSKIKTPFLCLIFIENKKVKTFICFVVVVFFCCLMNILFTLVLKSHELFVL